MFDHIYECLKQINGCNLVKSLLVFSIIYYLRIRNQRSISPEKTWRLFYKDFAPRKFLSKCFSSQIQLRKAYCNIVFFFKNIVFQHQSLRQNLKIFFHLAYKIMHEYILIIFLHPYVTSCLLYSNHAGLFPSHKGNSLLLQVFGFAVSWAWNVPSSSH